MEVNTVQQYPGKKKGGRPATGTRADRAQKAGIPINKLREGEACVALIDKVEDCVNKYGHFGHETLDAKRYAESAISALEVQARIAVSPSVCQSLTEFLGRCHDKMREMELQSKAMLPIAGERGHDQLGNTCWLNSALTCLERTYKPCVEPACASLRRATKAQSVLIAIAENHRLQFGPSCLASYSPVNVLSALRCLDSDYKGNRQHDAHLALLTIMSSLQQSDPEQVDAAFKVVVRSSLTCHECGKHQHQDEDGLDIGLGIQGRTIAECMRDHFQEAELPTSDRWECPSCDRCTKSSKKLTLVECGHFMVLNVKRFVFDRTTLTSAKHQQAIVADHICALAGSTWHPIAVMSHLGQSLESGHWTSTVSHGGKWLEFDDSSVKRCDGPPRNGSTFIYKRFDPLAALRCAAKSFATQDDDCTIQLALHVQTATAEPLGAGHVSAIVTGGGEFGLMKRMSSVVAACDDPRDPAKPMGVTSVTAAESGLDSQASAYNSGTDYSSAEHPPAKRRRFDAGAAASVSMNKLFARNVLQDAKGKALAWCAENVIDGVDMLKEIEAEEEFISALNLPMGPTKLLRKLIADWPNVK